MSSLETPQRMAEHPLVTGVKPLADRKSFRPRIGYRSFGGRRQDPKLSPNGEVTRFVSSSSSHRARQHSFGSGQADTPPPPFLDPALRPASDGINEISPAPQHALGFNVRLSFRPNVHDEPADCRAEVLTIATSVDITLVANPCSQKNILAC